MYKKLLWFFYSELHLTDNIQLHLIIHSPVNIAFQKTLHVWYVHTSLCLCVSVVLKPIIQFCTVLSISNAMSEKLFLFVMFPKATLKWQHILRHYIAWFGPICSLLRSDFVLAESSIWVNENQELHFGDESENEFMKCCPQHPEIQLWIYSVMKMCLKMSAILPMSLSEMHFQQCSADN